MPPLRKLVSHHQTLSWGAEMSQEVMLAVISVAGSAVAVAKIIVEGVNWALRFLVEQLDKRQDAAEKRAEKLLDQCAEERKAFLETLNGYLAVVKDLRSEMNAHNAMSSQLYDAVRDLRKE